MANPPADPSFDWEMYRYIPSLAGAIVGMTVFLFLTLILLWQCLQQRNHLLVFVVIGTLCEVGGYAARIGSHFDNTAWAPFITQGTLLLVGPLFFAAAIYMTLGRTIVLAGGEHVSLIKPRWYSRIFVGADIFTLSLQGVGASIMGTLKLQLAIAGNKIVIAGLALQVATFVFFLAAAIDFHLRMERDTSTSTALRSTPTHSWRKMLWNLYILSALILFRCIVRLVDYAMGNAAYLMAHEWTLYVFDTVPMFLTVVLLLVLPPTKHIKKDYETANDPSEELVSGY